MNPKFFMPIILPPSEGENYFNYYNQFGSITVKDRGNDILRISLNYDNASSLYAMTDSYVTCYNPGATLPDGNITLTGAIVLEPTHSAKKHLNSNAPSILERLDYILYDNVDPSTFEENIRNNFEMNIFNSIFISIHWSSINGATPGTDTEKLNLYIDGILAGQISYHVVAGTMLGNIIGTSINGLYLDLTFFNSSFFNIILPVRFLPVGYLFHYASYFQTPIEVWEQHPLIVANNNIFTSNSDIYVKFEIRNKLIPGAKEPVIGFYRLKDNKPNSLYPDSVIDEQAVGDSSGIAKFSIILIKDEYNNYYFPDLYFEIINFGTNNTTGHSDIPSSWQTVGDNGTFWKDSNGRDGLYPNYNGMPLGTPSNPLTFRVGFDIHVNLQYFFDSITSPLPPGLRVTINTYSDPPIDFQEAKFSKSEFNVYYDQRMKEYGALDVTLFTIGPGENIFFGFHTDIEDASIGQVNTFFSGRDPMGFAVSTDETEAWYSSFSFSRVDFFRNYSRPSIGFSELFPEPRITCRNEDFSGLIYVLKKSRDFNILVYKFIGETNWTNNLSEDEDKNFYYNKLWGETLRPFSHPRSVIYLSEGWIGTRDKISKIVFHETKHQLQWVFNDISNFDVKNQFGAAYPFSHFARKITTGLTAYLEGFANFLESLCSFFNNTRPASIEEIETRHLKRVITLTPTLSPNGLFENLNIGEKVEGAFTAALSILFWEIIIGRTRTNINNFITNSDRRDIDDAALPNNNWLLTSNAQNKFKKYIWNPFLQMRFKSYILQDGDVEPTPRLFLDEMILQNPSEAHMIRGYFNAYNIGVVNPQITTPPVIISIIPMPPPTIPITITGTNFVASYNVEADVPGGSGSTFLTGGLSIQLVDPSTYVLTTITHNVTSSTTMTINIPYSLSHCFLHLKILLTIRGVVVKTLTKFNFIEFV